MVEATTLVCCRLPMKVLGDALALAASAPLAASRPAAPIRVAVMTAADRLTGLVGNLLRGTGIELPPLEIPLIRATQLITAGIGPDSDAAEIERLAEGCLKV
jgi:hypothetical protein